MEWQWDVLTAVVRLLFLLAPFMNVAKDFSLAGANLIEAREFANAGATRAILVSFPLQALITIWTSASKLDRCAPVNWMTVALYVVGAAVVAVLLYRVPTRLFRGSFLPFVWWIGFTALFLAVQDKVGPPAARLMCS